MTDFTATLTERGTIVAKILESPQIAAALHLPVALSGLIVKNVYLNEFDHLMFVLANGIEIDAGDLRGNPFQFEDFTPEQLEALRGPQGLQGEDGAPGIGIAEGGTDGQQLVKDGSDPHVTKWIDPVVTASDKSKLEDLYGVNGPVQCDGAGGFSKFIMKRAPMFDAPGDLTAGATGIGFKAPFAMEIKEVLVGVKTAPTGANLIVDIHKGDTTMYTTQANRPTIADGETSATVVLPDVVSIAKDDTLWLEIDQIGSTVAGSSLTLTLICEEV